MNKLIVIAVVLVLAAVGWYALNTANAPESVPATTTPTETMTAEKPATEDHEMMGEETATTNADASTSVPTELPPGEGINFTVKGSNYAFDVQEIRVKEGDTVTINFESSEGFHDWVVDEFDAATAKVRPGTPTSVTFVASKAGTYEYYCSVGSHRAQGMVGTLIVE